MHYICPITTNPIGSSGVQPGDDGYYYLGHIRCYDVSGGITVSPQVFRYYGEASVTISGASFRASSTFSCVSLSSLPTSSYPHWLAVT